VYIRVIGPDFRTQIIMAIKRGNSGSTYAPMQDTRHSELSGTRALDTLRSQDKRELALFEEVLGFLYLLYYVGCFHGWLCGNIAVDQMTA